MTLYQRKDVNQTGVTSKVWLQAWKGKKREEEEGFPGFYGMVPYDQNLKQQQKGTKKSFGVCSGLNGAIKLNFDPDNNWYRKVFEQLDEQLTMQEKKKKKVPHQSQ